MNSESGLTVTKPVAVWNRPLKVNFKDLFVALGKGTIAAISQNWESVGESAVDATVAIGLGQEQEQVAWLLIYRSLERAIWSLIKDNREFFEKDVVPESLAVQLDLSLENIELAIDANFFQFPKRLPILESIKTPLRQWLEYFVAEPAKAEVMSNRLPEYFPFALDEEWRSRPEQYKCLLEDETPITPAKQRQQAWRRYRAWLQKQVAEPMFTEAFSLQQVYVPLSAYYVRQKANKKQEPDYLRHEDRQETERVVVDLDQAIKSWLEKADKDDAIRVICGGPGCGKSSYTKILAAHLAESEQLPVLHIPLHLFKPEADFVEALSDYILNDPNGLLPPNPLKSDNAEPRVLLIFDGLDELAMQGKVGSEVAQQFVREVKQQIDRFNHNQQQARLQVLVSGRDLVVEFNRTELRREGQILHMLPYFVPEDERKNYVGDKGCLSCDRRDDWWKEYGKVSGRCYPALPQVLKQENLAEITAQPLLNYLVALSHDRKRIEFTANTNLNIIYADLLDAIYERGWAGRQLLSDQQTWAIGPGHPALQGVNKDQFVRILEEVALSSWHGDGRTTTVRDIEAHCESSGLRRLLETFQEGAKTGVTRLLTAFYFRQQGETRNSEKTFEFTHKSFGEYLTAKRLVRGLSRIHDELQRREADPDQGWDEKQALHHWATLTGPSIMDRYLFTFICNELLLIQKSTVRAWQKTLCSLISVMLKRGMPMESLDPRPNYQEENRQARNAEGALLCVLNACARCTQEQSQIDWGGKPETFGEWLSRLQGQRTSWENTLALDCLSFLDLSNCTLLGKDLTQASLDGARLDRASLDRASLDGASLVGASLNGASLDGARLNGARLDRARLDGARLNGASLNRASLDGASLVEARLDGASLIEAILIGASLDRASLNRAILVGAILVGARLENIVWNQDTQWRNVRGLDKAINVPPKLLRQLGLLPKQ